MNLRLLQFAEDQYDKYGAREGDMPSLVIIFTQDFCQKSSDNRVRLSMVCSGFLNLGFSLMSGTKGCRPVY